MTRVRCFLLGALAALSVLTLAAPPLYAQTTLNQTTLAADVDAKQQVIPLVAVTNITASQRNLDGDLIFMDREAMQVNAIDTTAKTVTVRRAYGTSASAHASGAAVWTGPKQRFYYTQVVGKCTAANEQYLPHIVLPSANKILGGDVYDCVNGEWTPFKIEGFRAGAGLFDPTSTASGTVQSTEYTLNTVTIPAAEFAAARGVSCYTFGSLAANANAKNLKFYFGSTAVQSTTGSVVNGGDYFSEIVVHRTGASTQAGYGSLMLGTTQTAYAVTTSPTEAEGSAIVIKFTSANTAAAAASATGKGLYCAFLP